MMGNRSSHHKIAHVTAKRIANLILILWGMPVFLHAQQTADTLFNPVIPRPTYPQGQGPVVLIDEAHHNFHTLGGRYRAFGRVLQRDGYIVKSSSSPLNQASLQEADILVVSNALHERNIEDWSLPTPSAFTQEEIAAVSKWVESGGRLFLIADHMPFPGAAEALAAAFGFRFNNGFAIDTLNTNVTLFRRRDGSLADHTITRGIKSGEKIDSVRTFTGQAFLGPDEAEPLLIFRKPTISLMPETAWQFSEDTPTVPVDGWLQGAVMRFGRGRIAVFGEAAMFTAQSTGDGQRLFGMGSPGAEQNQQFLQNIMHWLSECF